MNKDCFSFEKDGFYGVYYPCPTPSSRAVIVMLGDSSDDHMVISAVKWLHRQGCNVMAMSSGPKDYSYREYPLETIESALEVLKQKGNRKLGIIGASTTGMTALAAASYMKDITLTIAVSPPDFIMEGFEQGKRDGAREWPAGTSSLSWRGKPLPYLPYAYRHPLYWKKVMEDSKKSHNRIASRAMFDESERLHPVTEEETIQVENIQGKLVLIGAEDDCLWDTCKYIRRLHKRLMEREHACQVQIFSYRYGTHFIFPQSMLQTMVPVGSSLLVGFMFESGRKNAALCRTVRVDLDRRLARVFDQWQAEAESKKAESE